MPGSASRSRRARSRSAPGIELDGAVPDRGAHAAQRLAPAHGHREDVVVGVGERRGVGEDVRERSVGRRQRLAVALHEAGGVRARGRDGDLLAEHGAHDDLGAVDAARARAGRGAPRRAARAPGRSRAPRRPTWGRRRGRAAGGSARRRRRGRARRRGAASTARSRRRARAPRSRCRAGGAACAGTRPPPSSPRRPRSRASRRTRTARPPRSARGRGGAARSCRRRPRSALRAVAAARVGDEREDLAHGVVELAHAREAGGERDLGEREVGRLDQRARRLRALRAGERERPGPELCRDEAVELAHAVAEPRGEPGDALAIDDAVADQAHRARDDVGARVPLGRAGRGVRPAALAGPEARALRRGRAAVEAHVGALRARRPGSSAGSRCRSR